MTHALFPQTPGNSTGPAVGVASRGIGAAIAQTTLVLSLALALAFGALVGLARPSEAATRGLNLPSARTAVVHLTNLRRAVKGCKPLKFSKRLTTAAQRHATDMSKQDYFSHTSLNGTTWDQRIERAGWKKPAGENIAYGFASATEVLQGWWESPGHKRNLLDCKFKYIGVGYAADGEYWVQDFGY
jgi:uncharacterized protein YkwD